MKIFIASLPASDPDAVLREHGPERLRESISSARPWFKWLAERIITPADADPPDPHDAVQEYVEAVKSLTIETEIQEALELCAELTNQKLAAVKREFKKAQKPDGRSVTSAANGQQGGRPRNPYADMADEFAKKFTREGVFGIQWFHGVWHRYRGSQWIEVTKDDVKGILMTWIRRNYRDLSENRTLINVLENLKSTELGHPLDDSELPCWLDQKCTPAPGWMPVKNAILHIPTVLNSFDGDEIVPDDSMIIPSTPRLFTPHSLPYQFDPEAQCPKWLKYLEGVQPNADDRDMIRKLVGLMLVPETRFNVFFILHGISGTGKSVFIHVLNKLIGKQNTCHVPLTKFEDEHYSHQLTTNLMNSIADMREVQLRDVEGTIKMATDGEMLDIRYQYNEGTSAQITARTVTSCNQLPRFYEKSDAIWERLRIVSFNVKFRNTPNMNKNLRHEIVADELPGIFVWALKGLSDLQDMNMFPEHSIGEAIKAKHKSACDPIGTFLAESFEAVDSCKLESAYIFDKYKLWAGSAGYRIANRGIVNREVERVFSLEKKVIKKSNGKTCQGFNGIGVIPGAFPIEDPI